MTGKKSSPPPYFGPLKLAARLLAVIFLVFATYNPSGRSYVHWVLTEGSGPLSLQIGAGLLLTAAAALLIRLGTAAFGRLQFAAGLVAITLLGVGLRETMGGEWGTMIVNYITLVAIAAWLTVGISWSGMRRRLTGQTSSRKV